MKKRYCFLFLLIIFLTIHHRQVYSQDASIILDKDHTLYANFLDFAFSRVQLLNRNFLNTSDNILIESKDTLCVAIYQKVDPSSVIIEVKKVDSRQTPFIGVLRYTESVYESNGACHANLVNGPFVPVRHRKVTEIFRYVQNRWQ